MILRAIERGVPEERIARDLNVNVPSIRAQLKKMAPRRQIEAVELMVAVNKYTISYPKSLLAALPQSQLAEAHKAKAVKG